MDKRLEVKVDGEMIGSINIIRNKNALRIISDVILPDGNYLFTEKEIKEMIMKKTQPKYPGKKIEITEYPSNVEFVATAGNYPKTSFIIRNQD